MSWEGYEQVLCKNGHQYTRECEYFSPPKNGCPNCGEKDAFVNVVDITNGSYETGPDGYIDYSNRIDGYMDFKVKTPMEFHTCECGNTHIIKEATYKIPKKKKKWRG